MKCDYSLTNCPDNKFMCLSTGSCIDINKRCDGILDCDDGSDESRQQNCSQQIANINCGNNPKWFYADNGLHKLSDSGMFKCNNGQCIKGQYMCDGIIDCIDGSDEYSNFYASDK